MVEVMVFYWYSIVSVGIVVAAVVGSVYVVWNKERQSKVVKQRLNVNESLLLYNPEDDEAINSVSWSQEQLWTSCWRGLHPAYLLALRLLSFFVLAFFLSWDLHHWGASIFIYYTEWTYSLVMMYFAIGSVVSAHGCWLCYTHKNRNENVEDFQARGDVESENITPKKGTIKLQRQYYPAEQESESPGFWGYLMQTAYQITAGAVVLTDIIFWCIIVPFVSNSRLGLNLLMGCIHTVNIAFLLLDTSINRLTFPWFRLSYFVLWSSVYVIFQWLIHLCGFTWWPYPFLKLSTPLSPLWYLVLAVFHIACYGMYALIVQAKNSLFSKLFPHSYII
ncbi:uncharacterized protein LOC104894807 [Beta vulgaris subsp. vulgaris]|uniref:uncharacterized protein LOC104894807 n=1 Tax=Beta vulgaris subsp. vulgaris TaxID=3555 RepID=UPI0020371F25|nr:uncharacterized protein LOC104894807 [Beta vulgaris subsp. vulgaris]